MIVAVFSFVGSLILYKITDLIIPLRVTDRAGGGWASTSASTARSCRGDVLTGACRRCSPKRLNDTEETGETAEIGDREFLRVLSGLRGSI